MLNLKLQIGKTIDDRGLSIDVWFKLAAKRVTRLCDVAIF
jgi:hypothetical protein